MREECLGVGVRVIGWMRWVDRLEDKGIGGQGEAMQSGHAGGGRECRTRRPHAGNTRARESDRTCPTLLSESSDEGPDLSQNLSCHDDHLLWLPISMPPLVPPKPAHPPPANWPKEIHYLTQPFCPFRPVVLYCLCPACQVARLIFGHPPRPTDSGVPPEVIALIQSKNPPPKHQPVTSVEIKFITDPKHPAYGQRGLFAKKKMVKGDLIVW